MKVELDDLRIGISAFGGCQVGIMDKKNPSLWKHKKEIHNDFIHAVVTNWKNKKEVFTQDGYQYEVSVKVTKIGKKPVAKKKPLIKTKKPDATILVKSYPTKHKEGFTNKEIAHLLKTHKVDKKKFNEAMGVNTGMMIDGDSITFASDIISALNRVMYNQKQHPLAWD